MTNKDLKKFNPKGKSTSYGARIPDAPGVYFFLKGREILYIGKATSLRDRARSYFGKDLIETRGPLLVDMVFKANKIKWQVTDSALEALILEASLIKKHQPYYNTREKDDRSFLQVIITKEALPRVFAVRATNLKNPSKVLKNTKIANIYGPFTNGGQLREALKIVRRIFPFLDNKSKNYLEFYKQINLVPDLDDRKMYLQNIRNIKLFFSGKRKKILANLKKEMKAYAKRHEFEKAGEIKRQIFALQHINDVALINNSPRSPRGTLGDRVFRIEAYDIAHMAGLSMVGVMTVVEGGEVEKREYKKFRIKTQPGANDIGALKEILERRLAHTEWTYPDLIVVDGGKAQFNAYTKIMSRLNLDIPTVAVVKDDRHKPKGILGDQRIAKKYEREILLANGEAHRFAITYHKKLRGKNFLK